MSIVKEGWVEKCGPKIMPTWHRRWLVLYDSRVLEYFIDDTKRKLQGVIELTGSEDLNIDGDPGRQFTKGFHLSTDSRTYKFAVKSATQRSLWISALRDVISGRMQDIIEARRKKELENGNNSNNSDEDGNNDSNGNDMIGKPTSMSHSRTQSQGATVLTFEKFTSYSNNVSKQSNSGSRGSTVADNNGGGGGGGDRSYYNRAGSVPSKLASEDDSDEKISGGGGGGGVVVPPRLSNVNEDDSSVNDKSSLNYLVSKNSKILSCIVSFLIDSKKNDFGKLFEINKAFRNNLSINETFYDNYTIYIYPKHVLKRFSDRRSPTRPWIMAHDYKQIWVFGNVERMTYAHLDLKPFNLDNVRKIFIDDPKLWDVYVDEIEDILYYLQNNEKKVEELTVRCWKANPGWIQQLPKLRKICSLTMEFSFQRSVLSRNIINPSNLLFLSLRRVDLLTDEKNDDIALRAAFHSLDRLIVCNLEESRWEHPIVLPPQLKILRYIPSDKSDIDVSRLLNDNQDDSSDDNDENDANEDDNNNNNNNSNTYSCELIIKQELWPNVLNHNIICGHEAYQKRKLRVWVLKKSRRWDGKLLYVNYCNQPPPMKVFSKESCYSDVLKLDNLQNMGPYWASKNTKYYRKIGQ